MDPITTAILAAIAQGIITGAAQAVGENPINDAYQKLKAILKGKFGNDSDIVEAVDKVEERPDSEVRKELLKEEVEIAGVDQDPEVRQAAQELLDRLRAQPSGEQHIQSAEGSYIAQANHGSTAEVRVNRTEE